MNQRRSIALMFLLFCTFVLAITALSASSRVSAETFTWKSPNKRENGQNLSTAEIGCYEIVGKDSAGKEVWRAMVPGGGTQVFTTNDPVVRLATNFLIAVCDTDGLYSEFVPIKPVGLLPPASGGLRAPTGGGLR